MCIIIFMHINANIYDGKGDTMGSTGASKVGGGGGSSNISGEVTFDKIVNASNNSIAFDKIVTVMPGNGAPYSGKKGDLANLTANINDVVINMYRDKAGANDLKRMQNLGFEIIASYHGTQQEGSSIPPRDYYYMKRKK